MTICRLFLILVWESLSLGQLAIYSTPKIGMNKATYMYF